MVDVGAIATMRAFFGILFLMIALVLMFTNVAGIEDGASHGLAKRYRYGYPLRYKSVSVNAKPTTEDFVPFNLIVNVGLIAGSIFLASKLMEPRNRDA